LTHRGQQLPTAAALTPNAVSGFSALIGSLPPVFRSSFSPILETFDHPANARRRLHGPEHPYFFRENPNRLLPARILRWFRTAASRNSKARHPLNLPGAVEADNGRGDYASGAQVHDQRMPNHSAAPRVGSRFGTDHITRRPTRTLRRLALPQYKPGSFRVFSPGRLGNNSLTRALCVRQRQVLHLFSCPNVSDDASFWLSNEGTETTTYRQEVARC
jgi:hypothetical protein